MKETMIELGTIELGNEVYVTDPCYNTDVWCMALIKNLKKGLYKCFGFVSDEGDWGMRNSRLTIVNADYTDKVLSYDFLGYNIGVDSGQAGFFDKAYYEKYHNGEYVDDNPDDNAWYNRVCDITLNGDNCGTIDNKGVVSSSGYGDGCYSVYGAYNENNELIALQLEFIWDDDEDEEDFDVEKI